MLLLMPHPPNHPALPLDHIAERAVAVKLVAFSPGTDAGAAPVDVPKQTDARRRTHWRRSNDRIQGRGWKR